MKKALIVATVDAHVRAFHQPLITLLQKRGYEVHVATSDPKYFDGVTAHAIPFTRSPLSRQTASCLVKLRQLKRTHTFDVVHAHTPIAAALVRLIYMRSGVKMIYTAHGFHFYTGARMMNWLLYYPVERFLATTATHMLLTINRQDFQRATGWGACEVRHIDGVGVALDRFSDAENGARRQSIRARLGVKDTDCLLVFPAELSPPKRHIWLLQALEPLLQSGSSYHLVLAGRDNLSGEVQRAIQDMNIAKNVHYIGFFNDIPGLLWASDVAVSSSEREGLPVNIIESVAAGLPIVATNCRGINEIIDGVPLAEKVPVDDTQAFLRAVKRMPRARRINGAQYAERFEVGAVVEQLHAIYDDVMNEKA